MEPIQKQQEKLQQPFESCVMREVSTTNNSIYSIVRSNRRIILKVLSNSHEQNIKKLHTELTVGKTICHYGIRRSIDLTTYENKNAISLEWADGYPLCEIKKFSVKDFIAVAREIVSALLSLHTQSIAHTNLTCDHIIYDPNSHCIKLIGIGSSVKIEEGGKRNISHCNLLEKDLHYVSPEMGSMVKQYFDLRSDFYSLGIIFYKMLIGRYPFQSEDRMKLIILHITQEPLSVHDVDPSIPIVISQMISKLLDKHIDERYQTAKGLIYDLDMMISEYDTDATLNNVVLAKNDHSSQLCLTNRLYDRNDDYNTLYSVLNKISSNSNEVVFVTGDSGTGKTSLIMELYSSVAKRNGILMYGKYDYSTQTPFAALIDAAYSLCDFLLLSNESTRSIYRSQIQEAVGEQGKLLTDIIPNLHLIIGQQRPMPDSLGPNAKNRLNYVFVKFIKAICSLDSPVVLVLEDLQLLDIESLDLLSAMITDKYLKNMMFIGTYRENEDNDDHPALRLRKIIKNSKSRNVTTIELSNLSHESVNDLVSDTLKTPPMKSYPLSVLIHKLTKGNPFFVNQMLKSFVAQGILSYCNESCSWQWDEADFNSTDINADVLEILRNKIKSFDSDTQQALMTVGCLGSPFFLSSLKIVLNDSKGIENALSTEMIIPCHGSSEIFRFSHDKVQEAVFSLAPNDTETFLLIAMKLWKNLSQEDLDRNIFPVANLLCRALDGINDEAIRLKTAQLILFAGQKAIMQTAFEIGLKYLKIGIELLSVKCWEDNFDFAMTMYDVASKAAYCARDYDYMEDLIDMITEHTTSVLQLAQSCSLRINSYNDRAMHLKSYETGIRFLSKIGHELDYSKCEIEIEAAIALYSENGSEDILSEPMSDERSIAIMTILYDVNRVSWSSEKSPRFALIPAQMVQLTYRYGVTNHAPKCFAAFGSSMYIMGNFEIGRRFGEVSRTLMNNNQESIPHVMISYYLYINPSFHSIHDSIQPLLEMARKFQEIGNLDGARMAYYTRIMLGFESGKYLPSLKKDFEEFEEAFPVFPKSMLVIYYAILNLIGENENDGNPAIILRDNIKSHLLGLGQHIPPGIAFLCRYISYIFQDYTAALSFGEHIEHSFRHQAVLFNLHGYAEFYDGLVSLALARYDENHEKWIEKAKKNISKIRLKSSHSPNCLNKLSLLEAELAAAYCDIETAEYHYIKAISLSRKFAFINEEALACERAGLFFLEMNSLEKACQYLIQSYNCYKKWGAVAKMEHLIQNHVFLKDFTDKPVSDVAAYMGDVKLGQRTDRSVSSSINQGKKKAARTQNC